MACIGFISCVDDCTHAPHRPIDLEHYAAGNNIGISRNVMLYKGHVVKEAELERERKRTMDEVYHPTIFKIKNYLRLY